jgi:hypothetical protein
MKIGGNFIFVDTFELSLPLLYFFGLKRGKKTTIFFTIRDIMTGVDGESNNAEISPGFLFLEC